MQNELILALCWTLIHSLWQGLLLATLTGLVMICTRKSNARKRYGLLNFLFFLFIAVAAVTFVKEFRLAGKETTSAVSPPVLAVSAQVITDMVPQGVNSEAANQSWTDRFKDYFNTHASLIVMIWLVIFIARFIRLTANLAYVQRLKHYKTYAPPAIWKDKVNELVLRIGIKKKIQLLESGVVKVPVVIGVLKPVILLPLGLLAHLPADEIEAILLHELAHIKRRDYFMNLLQSFAETIFFFNPALMWLSSTIREERENCCDDIAISITNSKTKFINALISFQEYNFSTPAYTVGFPGRKNQLLNRVKRIVNDRNKTLNATEKSLLTFGMGVFILFSFAAAKKITPLIKEPTPALVSKLDEVKENAADEQQSPVSYLDLQKPVTEKQEIVSDFDRSEYSLLIPEFIDTTPRKIQPRTNSGRSVFSEEKLTPVQLKTYSTVSDSLSNLFTGISVNRNSNDGSNIEVISATRKDGTLYDFRKVNGKITALSIDNKEINPNDFAKYDAVINDIDNALKYRKERSEERRALAAADRERMMLDKQSKLFESKLKLNEQRLLDQEARRIAMEQKRNLLLQDKHLRNDSLLLHKQKERLLNDSKLKISEKAKLDLVRKPEGRVKLDSKMTTDSLQHFKKDRFSDLHINSGVYSDSVHINPGADRFRDLNIKGKVRIDSSRNKGYARYGDVVKYADLTDEMEAKNRKKENMRARAAEDEERVQGSATIMRNIIKDLEAEGISFNMQSGWFALDKDQFVVDGKSISAALHEKFRNRYIKPKDGWGYYYGPIKVTGRGIFLDYKNLVR